MGKLALCIKRPAAMPADGLHSLHSQPVPMLPVELIDRDICENPENGYLQLIPYIAVVDDEDNIYTYHRGGAGDEARLHAKLSIGLGGHVDRLPNDGEALLTLFQAEGARELQEEVGLEITERRPIHFHSVLIDTTDDVGRVHLGVFGTYYVNAFEKGKMTAEKGVIEKGEFLPLEKLRDDSHNPRLENWSRIAVDVARKVEGV